MTIKSPRREQFVPTDESQNQRDIEQLLHWERNGKTTAVFFGRCQPLHYGHIGLLKAMRASGLNLHVFLNEKVNTPNEKNPYNIYQKRQMFKVGYPDFPQSHIHIVDGVYLGAGGDIQEDLKRLLGVFLTAAPTAQTVFMYARKTEDVKTYQVGEQIYEDVHYADVLSTYGGLDQQIVTPAMIREFFPYYGSVAGSTIGATAIRNGDRDQLMPPGVKEYLDFQQKIADGRGVKVGCLTEAEAQMRPSVEQQGPYRDDKSLHSTGAVLGVNHLNA